MGLAHLEGGDGVRRLGGQSFRLTRKPTLQVISVARIQQRLLFVAAIKIVL